MRYPFRHSSTVNLRVLLEVVPASRRIYQPLQFLQQRWLLLLNRLSSSAQLAHPLRWKFVSLKLPEASMDSGATQTAGHRHNSDAASTEQLRVRSHHQPLLTLIEIGTQKSIFLLKSPSRLLVHTSTIKCFSPDVQLILAGMLWSGSRNPPRQWWWSHATALSSY